MRMMLCGNCNIWSNWKMNFVVPPIGNGVSCLSVFTDVRFLLTLEDECCCSMWCPC